MTGPRGSRRQPREQGFVTPDGSASTRQRDREWAEALEAAGGIQIESFNPIEVINIAALQAKLKARASTPAAPAAPETPPAVIHWSMVDDDGSAMCWEGDHCPDEAPIISTEIREVTCAECQQHYNTLNDLKRAGIEAGTPPEPTAVELAELKREARQDRAWEDLGHTLREMRDEEPEW